MGLKLYKLVLGTETGLGTIALGKQVTVLKQTVEVCPNLYGRCCEKPLAQFDKKLAGSIVCSLQSCAIVLSSAPPFSVTSSVKISFPANAGTLLSFSRDTYYWPLSPAEKRKASENILRCMRDTHGDR